MSGEICTDNRFKVIEAYKKKLIECTNIETSPEEMSVIDNVLFRFWQMNWLPNIPHGRLIDADAFLALINDCTILSNVHKWFINSLISGEPTVIEAEE